MSGFGLEVRLAKTRVTWLRLMRLWLRASAGGDGVLLKQMRSLAECLLPHRVNDDEGGL